MERDKTSGEAEVGVVAENPTRGLATLRDAPHRAAAPRNAPQRTVSAPGLKWRARARGEKIPYWIASVPGYPIRSQNLSALPIDQIEARCIALQEEMLAWSGQAEKAFDGTLGSLISIYETHEDSPYQTLKPASRHPYDCYLAKIKTVYGGRHLSRLTGLDVKAMHKIWRAPTVPGGHEKLGAAATALAVLKAVISFGVVSGFADCSRLSEAMSHLRLPSPAPRNMAPTAADIDRARKAAHEMGRPRAALCFALQFETTCRQWDLIGSWVPMSDPTPSAILYRGQKWIGPTWANIDENLVLSITPTKTERTTGARVHVGLRNCLMTMQELEKIPASERKGPLIVDEKTGLPYPHPTWTNLWQNVRTRAGLDPKLWNRDLRSGGVTEGQMAGATSEDRAKLSGHSQKVNEDVYARDRLVASDRVIEARMRFRKGTVK